MMYNCFFNIYTFIMYFNTTLYDHVCRYIYNCDGYYEVVLSKNSRETLLNIMYNPSKISPKCVTVGACNSNCTLWLPAFQGSPDDCVQTARPFPVLAHAIPNY